MNRHLVFIILISILLSACVQRNDFKAYRYNPFQYPYPEYYIEADTITVEAVTFLDFQDMGRIEFFNKTAYIPMNLLDPTPISANDDKVIFKKDNKILIIERIKDTSIGCLDELTRMSNRDFCSSFSSSQEFFDILFTKTPDILFYTENKRIGYQWILHKKGIYFENVKYSRKYIGKNFIAYESKYIQGKMTKDLILFFEGNKNYFYTISTNIDDTNFFDTFLKSIR
jgi:hypothetical protein